MTPAAREAWDRAWQKIESAGAAEVPAEEVDTVPRSELRRMVAPADDAAPTDAPTTPATHVAHRGWAGSWPQAAPSRQRGRWVVLALAVALVAALAVSPFLIGGGFPWSDDGPSAAPTGVSPVDPVHGWTDEAAWVSPAIAKGDHAPTVLVAEDTAITTTEKSSLTHLTALRSTDGAELWSSPIQDPLTGPPQLITWDGERAVIAATQNVLYLWPDLGSAGAAPTPRTWNFTEADVTLVPGSPVPMLANEETLTALVLEGDTLHKRALPSGGQPVAGDEQGRAHSVGQSGHWWASTDETETPEATLLKPPAYGSLPTGVLGVGGETLVVSWTRGKGTSHLAGYDVTDGMKPVWTTKIAGRPSAEDFHPSPDGTWAVVGTVAVNLSSGRQNPLSDDWETVRVTDDRAWAQRYTATKGGEVSRLAETISDPGVPVAVTDKGLGLIIAAEGDAAPRIYALRRDPDA